MIREDAEGDVAPPGYPEPVEEPVRVDVNGGLGLATGSYVLWEHVYTTTI